jgi:hypothetical protein
MIGRRAGPLSIAGALPGALATLYFVAIGAMGAPRIQLMRCIPIKWNGCIG